MKSISYKILHTFAFSLFLLISFSACLPEYPSITDRILISQVLAGIDGNNNYEFIELYNPGNDPVDLKGWTLFYKQPGIQNELIVFRWKDTSFVPAQGHYLLVRNGESVGLTPDAEFEQSINVFDGGLQLQRSDKTIADRVGWGKAPDGYFEGGPIIGFENGISLERLPTGSQGNSRDSNNNVRDFKLVRPPEPRNTGSMLTPFKDKRLAITIDTPDTVESGAIFNLLVSVSNQTDIEVNSVQALIPLPASYQTKSLPANVTREGNELKWTIPKLFIGESRQIYIPIQAPYTFGTFSIKGYRVHAQNWNEYAFGSPRLVKIEGGIVPISAARALTQAELIIEGTVTMYTGGYFAGANNTKFYVQDETAGIQVQVFGGQGKVSVKIGDRVRIRGKIDIYRDAVEIIPIKVPYDVQVLEPTTENQPPTPLPVEISQTTTDRDTLPGRLIQVEGAISRLQEMNYNYDIDLLDKNGNKISLYVDKQTNIKIDHLESGQMLRATGIFEGRDAKWVLYPRLQEDLQVIHNDPLQIEVKLPLTVTSDETFTVTFRISNNTTDQILRNIQVTAPLPEGPAQVDQILDGGIIQSNQLRWVLTELPPKLSRDLRCSVKATSSDGYITIGGYTAIHEGDPSPVTGIVRHTFVSTRVPIWAIQGAGFRSPYAGLTLATQGVVTGIFPGLSGFWIQNPQPDEDQRTSEGLFIYSGANQPQINPGDLVEVNGIVREISEQTSLIIGNSADVKILQTAHPLLEPVELDPPDRQREADVYFEALEGMFVKVSGPARSVSPTSHYGEYVIVTPRHPVTRLYQGQDNGFAIMVDDGSNITYGDSSKLPYKITTGDTISNLIGPLAYTFNRYKIEPVNIPEIVSNPTKPQPLASLKPDEFSLMTWNTLNLFDLFDPHPADPAKPTPEQYQRDIKKVAATIVASGLPVVIGLQEVENLKVLQDIADQPILAPYSYRPILIEGSDSRGIDVGFLIRGDRARIIESKAFPDTSGLFSRPPLMVRIQAQTSQGVNELFVINNHFLSMSAGVEATETRRLGQANWNVKLVKDILEKSPNANVAVMGDLNSFLNSKPINALRAVPLTHVSDRVPVENQYTYIFQGESQALDHILVSTNLANLIRRVDILHLNADFPPPDPNDESPIGKSDHDPIIVTFSLTPPSK